MVRGPGASGLQIIEVGNGSKGMEMRKIPKVSRLSIEYKEWKNVGDLELWNYSNGDSAGVKKQVCETENDRDLGPIKLEV